MKKLGKRVVLSDYETAIDIYLNYDSAINYSDCTILTTMFQNGISKIVTFDSDFEKIRGIHRISGFF